MCQQKDVFQPPHRLQEEGSVCRDRLASEMGTAHPPWASLVRTKWPEQTVLRRERDGRKRGPGRHPILTFHLCSPRHPQTLRLLLSPSWPSLAARSARGSACLCQRHLCSCLSPHPHPAPAGSPCSDGALSPSTLVAWVWRPGVWGSGPAPACLLGAGRVPGPDRDT